MCSYLQVDCKLNLLQRLAFMGFTFREEETLLNYMKLICLDKRIGKFNPLSLPCILQKNLLTVEHF